MKRYLALFLLLFTPLFAEDTINEITAKQGQDYNYLSDFINMLFTLAFVIVLIFVTVWVLKKILRSRVQTLNRTNGIKILERRPLNQKSSLYLVDILGKGVVISESPSGIQVITEFAENVKIEKLFEQLQVEQKPRISFKETLINKFKKSAAIVD